MKSPRRLAAAALVIGVAGVAVAGTFAQRAAEPRQISEAPVAAGAEPTTGTGVGRSELPRLGAAALLGGGLGGLAMLGRRGLV